MWKISIQNDFDHMGEPTVYCPKKGNENILLDVLIIRVFYFYLEKMLIEN